MGAVRNLYEVADRAAKDIKSLKQERRTLKKLSKSHSIALPSSKALSTARQPCISIMASRGLHRKQNSMKPSTIANIQQAGAWLRDAAQSLADEVSILQARATEAVASDAFNTATDAHIDDWKSVARIAQTVAAMEAQLKQVYLAAMGVGSDMPFKETPLLASSSTSSADIVDVPVRRVKRTPRPRQAVVAETGTQASAKLKGNTAKAYAFLKSKVADDGVAHVTQAEISQGASIAEGSVSFAISSLKKKGLVDESERGHYHLA